MSTITRTGNLAETPELRKDDKNRPYCFARILVTDRVRNAITDDWEDGGTIGYDVAVNGNDAENLVATAEVCGNVRVMFSGNYRVTKYVTDEGDERLAHEVRNANVGISLRGQRVTVER